MSHGASQFISIFLRSIAQVIILTVTLFVILIISLFVLLFAFADHEKKSPDVSKDTAFSLTETEKSIENTNKLDMEKIVIDFPLNNLTINLPSIFSATVKEENERIKNVVFHITSQSRTSPIIIQADGQITTDTTKIRWDADIPESAISQSGDYQVSAILFLNDDTQLSSKPLTVTLLIKE